MFFLRKYKKLINLQYARGVLVSKGTSMFDLWGKLYGLPIFCNTIDQQIFLCKSRCTIIQYMASNLKLDFGYLLPMKVNIYAMHSLI